MGRGQRRDQERIGKSGGKEWRGGQGRDKSELLYFRRGTYLFPYALCSPLSPPLAHSTTSQPSHHRSDVLQKMGHNY